MKNSILTLTATKVTAVTTIFLFAGLFLLNPVTVYAGNGNGGSTPAGKSATATANTVITVVIPQSPAEEEEPEPEPVVISLYPSSVYEMQGNGRREIIKTYELSPDENPDDISREAFIREGFLYELTDITRKETARFDTREHTEVVSVNTETKDLEAILKILTPTVEFTSDDGYVGILTLDLTTVQVEAAGTKKSSYTVSATREYPHLQSNDSSLIPKTITDNGKTLNLSGITWQTQNAETVDYSLVPTTYTAIATYAANASKTVVCFRYNKTPANVSEKYSAHPGIKKSRANT